MVIEEGSPPQKRMNNMAVAAVKWLQLQKTVPPVKHVLIKVTELTWYSTMSLQTLQEWKSWWVGLELCWDKKSDKLIGL
ncbi:hypothetical protein COLO4_14724 [Corchorus olitorius]|uniref:Uncharacterized protein n=1 Tax=Corchorus olitorius TaxID=93759 RepID=A0A1R3JRG3_9ROSI|nr:hypothetical protein COLO4_14724 [Corchorus olitorius]